MTQLNDIVIRIDPIELPRDAKYHHDATSYIVSKDRYFKDVILSDLKNRTNLYEIAIPADTIGDYQNIYAKVKIHFSNGKSLPWTEVNLNTNQSNIAYSTTIIATPSVEVGRVAKYPDKCIISPSDFKMYIGYGTHASTSYRIETINGALLFSRVMDVENKDYLPLCHEFLRTILKNDSIYIVKARHHSTTGEKSNWGVGTFITGNKYIQNHKR